MSSRWQCDPRRERSRLTSESNVPDLNYLQRQKHFWNVKTLDEARFDRVDTRTDRSEASWEALADTDIRHVFDGVAVPEGATVLELGCGVGRLLVRTRQRIPVSARLI